MLRASFGCRACQPTRAVAGGTQRRRRAPAEHRRVIRMGQEQARRLAAVLASLLAATFWLRLAAVPGWFMPPPPWPALLLLGLPPLLAWRWLPASAAAPQPPAPPRLRRRGLVPAGGALLCSSLLLFLLPAYDNATHYRLPLLLWLGGMGLLLLAARLAAPRSAPLPTRRPLVWLPATLAGLTLLALLLRLWRLDAVPFALGGDEASQGLEALRVIDGDLRHPLVTGWLGVPTLSFFLNSLTLRLGGATVAALRLPWALLGTATVPLVYLLGAELAGRRVGLLAAALLAAFHYHIHFSRVGSNQILDPLLLTLALWLLLSARRRGSLLRWTLAGLVAGLAFYFYAGARLTPLVLLGTVLLAWRADGAVFLRRHAAGMLLALGGWLAAAAPMLQYAWRFPADFNARINEVGVLQSGWLAAEATRLEVSPLLLLGDQLRRAALAFHYYPDRTYWYGLNEPLLDPVSGALLALGVGGVSVAALLALRGRRPTRGPAPPALAVWWWLATVLGGGLTLPAPASQRLVTLTVPAVLLLALAARWLTDTLPLRRRQLLLGAALLLYGVASLSLYFGRAAPSRAYGNPQAEVATAAAPLLEDVPPGTPLLFFGAPRMVWSFSTFTFLTPHLRGVDVVEPWTLPPHRGLVDPARGMVFLFLPERGGELQLVLATYPHGEYRPVESPVRGTIAGIYIVHPTAAPP